MHAAPQAFEGVRIWGGGTCLSIVQPLSLLVLEVRRAAREEAGGCPRLDEVSLELDCQLLQVTPDRLVNHV